VLLIITLLHRPGLDQFEKSGITPPTPQRSKRMERKDVKDRIALRDKPSTYSFFMKQKQIDSEADWKEITDGIAKNTNLKAIELTGSSYSLPSCVAIAEALAKKPGLEVFLMDDAFTRRKNPEIHPALTAFVASFNLMTNLTWLDLRCVCVCVCVCVLFWSEGVIIIREGKLVEERERERRVNWLNV
jgi:hypothetical protein